jgi:hypothetical protein
MCLILKAELNAENNIKAVGVHTVPVHRKSFFVIHWRLERLKNIDMKARKMLMMNGLQHRRAVVERVYVNRKEGGSIVLQTKGTYETETGNMTQH